MRCYKAEASGFLGFPLILGRHSGCPEEVLLARAREQQNSHNPANELERTPQPQARAILAATLWESLWQISQLSHVRQEVCYMLSIVTA